ncbi:TetR/AcrR family transcriptional regulator [Streptomyces sp. NPDC051976]|uniref:TetR/AcrR family transcriptional regulator n=1 Tax=Streptomyces sp. NPDC051976 TaxID=3154947 RepID=UPI0034325DFE
MTTTGAAPARDHYHHGDLRSACIAAALELLEEDAELSLRAVARRAGVSTGAPYRHFADKDELLSAIAAQGYRDLGERLAAASPAPAVPADFAEVAVAYVRFALTRPALFRVMFTTVCDRTSSERAAAAAELNGFVRAAAERSCPGMDPEVLATAAWGLVHGLAFLHLDGKLPADAPDAVDARVRASVHALVGG